MLKLTDFLHLPQLDALVEQMISERPGLIVVAGIDPHPSSGEWIAGEVFLPSGRPAIFNILIHEILETYQDERAVFLSRDKNAIRIPRQFKHRIAIAEVEAPWKFPGRARQVIAAQPDFLIVDQIDPESVEVISEAIHKNIRVISQVDTPTWGAAVTREMADLGLSLSITDPTAWVVTVKRLMKLCPNCREVIPSRSTVHERVRLRYPQLFHAEVDEGDRRPNHPGPGFSRPGSCASCQGTGRSGDIAIFDIYHSPAGQLDRFTQTSLFSLEEYIFHLAEEGILALDDLLWLDADHLRRTYHLLSASKRSNVDADAALLRKIIELEAANRVLRSRTEVLLSLQDLDQALTASVSLDDLAPRVCREVSTLCGADRVVLYFLRQADAGVEIAEILAVNGWGSSLVHHQLEKRSVFNRDGETEPSSYPSLPPGIADLPLDDRGNKIKLQTGMRVPLLAQGRLVGVMIVHSTKKKFFTPGETTLLQTYANQAAVAIQRAGLIEELRAKIIQLEAAQVELVKKERIERELELAREVQQSMLPRAFPKIDGYSFAAWNQPARQVGGDFFDLIVLDENHFGVAIADVSDKGMPAALFMALSRSLLLAEARRELSPRAVLANVNRLLMELGETRQFVSVFYGVVERSTHRLTYTRGGHDYPFLVRQGRVQPLVGKGTVLGIIEPLELELSEEQVFLESGDRLIFYTDGLTDVVNPGGEFYGLAQLQNALQKYGRLPAGEICNAIRRDLTSHQGRAEQYDDMTMVVIEVE